MTGKKGKGKARRAGDGGSALLAAPMALYAIVFVGVSLLYIIGLSFLRRGVNIGVTNEFTLDNYAKVANPIYFRVLLKSLRLALFTTLICLAVGYPFGYIMARMKPRTRNIVMMLVIVPFWTNALIRIYGWRIILANDGPLNSFLQLFGIGPLQLLHTEGAVLLGMVYALIPFVILPSYTSVEKMDWSVAEAARDLGASPISAFLTVTLPLTLQGILAGSMLVFIPSIGLFFISDILGGGKTPLVGNLIGDTLNRSRDMPFAAALSVILLALTLLIISLYRKAGGKNSDIALF